MTTIECMAMDHQCRHALVHDDGHFDLKKWGTIHWCDETYYCEFGDYGYHTSCNCVAKGGVCNNTDNGNDLNKHDDDDEFVETKMEDEENYEKGAADDLNATATVIVGQNDNIPHLTPSATYNKLTISFKLLAEDISKCPQLANMLHGFIVKAQQLLCNTKPNKVNGSFLQLFNSTTKNITQLNYTFTQSESPSSLSQNSNPITRPPPLGRPKTKQYKSLNETIKRS